MSNLDRRAELTAAALFLTLGVVGAQAQPTEQQLRPMRSVQRSSPVEAITPSAEKENTTSNKKWSGALKKPDCISLADMEAFRHTRRLLKNC